VENSHEGILIVDEAFRLIYCNNELSRIVGYARAELLGQDFRRFLDDESRRLVVDSYIRRQRGEDVPPRYEFNVITKTGDIRRVQVSSAIIKDSRGAVKTVAELMDITEKRRAEEALRESEEKFRTLAEQSPNMIFINQKGRIVYANARCQDIMGYSRAELYAPDFDFRALVAPEHGEKIAQNFGRHGRGEDVPPYEYTILTKQGARIEVILTTKLIDYEGAKAILGTITDITERKKSEKLKNAIYRISEAAHSVADLEELFRSIHEIIGELMPARNFYLALYDDDRDLLSFPYVADEFDEAPSPKKPGKGITEYVLRSGEPLLASPEVFDELVERGEVELVGTPSIDWLGVPLRADNKTIGVMAVQSYTEGLRLTPEDQEILKLVSGQASLAIKRKQAEKQIKDSLREKEALLQEIHHRVKNNLQIISSLLNLQSGQAKDRDFARLVKDSQSRIRSMALVHDKLYGSRDFSSINFSDYVRSLVVHIFQFHRVNPALIRLDLNLQDVFLNIQTAIPCGLILNELITNSLKHAFPSGRAGIITVELSRIEDQSYQLLVQDNGVGMPRDLDIEKGPSIGWQIVTLLAGQLEASLDVSGDGGTSIRIRFIELKYKAKP
jgi:PAS domain S-box-containing protein